MNVKQHILNIIYVGAGIFGILHTTRKLTKSMLYNIHNTVFNLKSTSTIVCIAVKVWNCPLLFEVTQWRRFNVSKRGQHPTNVLSIALHTTLKHTLKKHYNITSKYCYPISIGVVDILDASRLSVVPQHKSLTDTIDIVQQICKSYAYKFNRTEFKQVITSYINAFNSLDENQ